MCENMMLKQHSEFGQVRVVYKSGVCWFVAKDIAEVLGYGEVDNMTKFLDSNEQEIIVTSKIEDRQEVRQFAIISESGLYHAILASRNPNSKAFRKWITGKKGQLERSK